MARTDRWASEDVVAADSQPRHLELEVRHGMTLTHSASSTTGTVGGFSERDRVVLVDQWGRRREFKALDGAFTYRGTRVALRKAASAPPKRKKETPSGSVAVNGQRAKTARASRIWVEGLHDAELLERVWGDDLRTEAIVVEPMHGADGLVDMVAAFEPGNSRRLGLLLDHLAPGSKEARIAADVSSPHVLACGHPYVDIWAGIAPATIGVSAWPEVPHGRPWKQGVIEALGLRTETGVFWRQVLAAVDSYRDLEAPLVNAVERLIDFVAAEG